MLVREIVLGLIAGWLALSSAGQAPLAQSIDATIPAAMCDGALAQGGVIVCNGPASTRYILDGSVFTASQSGQLVVGLRRDAAPSISIVATHPQAASATEFSLAIATRDDAFRTIEGMDCDKVDARTPEQIDHAGRSWVIKQEAFARFSDGPGAGEGFIRPAEGVTSSPFGPTRRYIGISAVTGEPCEKTSVHRGYDIAAPVGTPILAPAGGTVILADDDLYYEGGTVFLDHGHGLVSVFMHMSALDVAVGDVLVQGQQVGAVGNTGRTTGPHLHWAVKWRNTAATSRNGDFYIDPALLLELPRTPR